MKKQKQVALKTQARKSKVYLLSLMPLTAMMVACGAAPAQNTTLGDDLKSPAQDKNLANKCSDWKKNNDGSYQCEQAEKSGAGNTNNQSSQSSVLPFMAGYYFNGMMYNDKNAMTASTDYRQNNLVNGTKLKSTQTNKTNTGKPNLSKTTDVKPTAPTSKTAPSPKPTSSAKSGFGSGAKGSSSS